MIKIVAALLVLISIQITSAQVIDFKSQLKKILNTPGLGEDYLRSYVKPFATAYGTAMGGAIYHRASVKSFPKFDIGINFVYMSVPDEAKSFSFDGAKVPTFFGSASAAGDVIQGSGLSSFYLPILQLNLGLVSNFEITTRIMKATIDDEIGEISLIGAGVKYGFSDMIPVQMFPIDLSVLASYHAFSISEWLSSATFNINFQASSDIPLTTLGIYAGVGYGITSLTIKTNELPDIGSNGIGDVSIDGENDFRFNFGLNWTLLLLNLHLDYNIGEYNSLAGGLMLVF